MTAKKIDYGLRIKCEEPIFKDNLKPGIYWMPPEKTLFSSYKKVLEYLLDNHILNNEVSRAVCFCISENDIVDAAIINDNEIEVIYYKIIRENSMLGDFYKISDVYLNLKVVCDRCKGKENIDGNLCSKCFGQGKVETEISLENCIKVILLSIVRLLNHDESINILLDKVT